MSRVPLLALIIALALVTGGCGGSGDKQEKDKSPTARLAAATKYLESSDAYTVSLSTPKLPTGVQGILKAQGTGTTAPAFKGSIGVVQSGLSLTVPVIATGGKTYIQFGGSWRDIDPTQFGAPDPAQLFVPGKGFGALVKATTDVKKGEDTREGKQILSTLKGSIPGSAVKGFIPTAQDEDFAALYTVDDQDHLTKLVLSGPFYPDADDVTYTVRFSSYGKKISIAAPTTS